MADLIQPWLVDQAVYHRLIPIASEPCSGCGPPEGKHLNKAVKILARKKKKAYCKMAAWQETWIQKQSFLILKRRVTHKTKPDTWLLSLGVHLSGEPATTALSL